MVRVLVATDIAARGLDIDRLPHVVNYELPNVPEDYIHRIGRTARAGQDGHAVSLVCVDENKLLSDIERLLKTSIDRVAIRGYEPDPSIKPEPIQKGRQQRAGGRNAGAGARARNGGRNSAPRSRSGSQNRSRGRSSGGQRRAA
jgi:ATP-dependent RNA helicase RhlE